MTFSPPDVYWLPIFQISELYLKTVTTRLLATYSLTCGKLLLDRPWLGVLLGEAPLSTGRTRATVQHAQDVAESGRKLETEASLQREITAF